MQTPLEISKEEIKKTVFRIKQYLVDLENLLGSEKQIDFYNCELKLHYVHSRTEYQIRVLPPGVP